MKHNLMFFAIVASAFGFLISCGGETPPTVYNDRPQPPPSDWNSRPADDRGRGQGSYQPPNPADDRGRGQGSYQPPNPADDRSRSR